MRLWAGCQGWVWRPHAAGCVAWSAVAALARAVCMPHARIKPCTTYWVLDARGQAAEVAHNQGPAPTWPPLPSSHPLICQAAHIVSPLAKPPKLQTHSC